MDTPSISSLLAARTGRKVVVELGTGGQREYADSISVDLVPGPNVDISGPAEVVLANFPSESVDEICARHFLEHTTEPRIILELAARALRVGGKLLVTVPHFTNPYFFSDPTHRHFFGLYSFAYYAESRLFDREVPAYIRVPNLRLDDVKLGFRSVRPFYLRHALRRTWGFVVNSSRYMQELYEEAFSNLISCYEITATISKVSSTNGPRAGQSDSTLRAR